ncbi:MAG: MaoC family dehydratase N-terminal domain-containing protein [Chloroflexi bacterium]|nr:MaoC family dehydratase N-terminal domain-containing protein [Chloroflexota bacterium]
MAEETGGLIPPETLAMVGELLGEPVSAEITAKEAQRYAQAVGDLDPIYFDEAAAKAAGYRGLVAPPTFVSHVVVQGQPLDRLREDGLFRTGARAMPLRVRRSMFGGEEWDFLEPACVGDTITAESRLKAIEEKQGGSGAFVLTTRETTYTNRRGEVVARARQIGIAR